MDPYSKVLDYAMGDNLLTKVYEPTQAAQGADSSSNDDFIMIVGFDRTGTKSIMAALAKLGYRCYSLSNAYCNDKDRDIWLNLLQQKYEKFVELENAKSSSSKSKDFLDWNVQTMVKYEWDTLFTKEYNACCGSPSNVFFLEIKAHFHGKFKVILSLRESGDVWYQSVIETWYRLYTVLSHFLFRISVRYNKQYKLIKYIYLILFKLDLERFKEKEQQRYLIQRYYDWKKFVKRSVFPGKRLLLYNVKDGWEPLCKFLGKQIPKKGNNGKVMGFPHKCKRDEFRKLIKSAHYAEKVALNFWIVIGIVLALLVRYIYH